MCKQLVLSALGHTWIFDLDGTIVKHNGYKIDGHDSLLPGVKTFFENNVTENDFVILVTSRPNDLKEETIAFLNNNGIKFNEIIFGLPYGERIVVNDKKPSGLSMSKAIDLERDSFEVSFMIDESL